jgi:hypothetical protein
VYGRLITRNLNRFIKLIPFCFLRTFLNIFIRLYFFLLSLRLSLSYSLSTIFRTHLRFPICFVIIIISFSYTDIISRLYSIIPSIFLIDSLILVMRSFWGRRGRGKREEGKFYFLKGFLYLLILFHQAIYPKSYW